MSARARVELASPAKVNPRLEVLARRADGLHEVRTTLLALDLEDELAVALASSGRDEVTVSGPAATPDVPRDARNLALRAARLVAELARPGRSPGFALHVEKRVPSRAGLGGGSSNAAAAALGACLLLDHDPDDPELARRLGELGADVPFFLRARSTGHAHATGRGERVEVLAAPDTPRALVLLTPEVECATAAVYAALELDELRGAPSDVAPDAWARLPLEEARAALANDLEAAALRSHPALGAVRRALDAGGARHFRLSGSGSSFFGLFADRDAAEGFLAGETISRISRDHGLRVERVVSCAGRGAAARTA